MIDRREAIKAGILTGLTAVIPTPDWSEYPKVYKDLDGMSDRLGSFEILSKKDFDFKGLKVTEYICVVKEQPTNNEREVRKLMWVRAPMEKLYFDGVNPIAHSHFEVIIRKETTTENNKEWKTFEPVPYDDTMEKVCRESVRFEFEKHYRSIGLING